ncbi:MAG: hypothetical protein HYZ72_09085 [Deltaproteobacteria bacterium]|nr:hypothetical protein [Deltaproteobacteria bacterium]
MLPYPYALSLSAVPSGVLDMTADFAPLFIGMVVGLGLCVLGLAFTIGVHDTRKAQRKAQQATDGLAALPKAA